MTARTRGPEFTRALTTHVPAGNKVTGEVIDGGGRRVKAIIATDIPGRDGLTLDVANAKFRRKELPLIVGHDLKSLPVGVAKDFHVERRGSFNALVATLEFGRGARAQEIYSDVKSNLVNEVSIGFDVPKGERDWRTGRARPLITEVSLVPVAMDSESVIFERSHTSTYQRAFPLELDEQENTVDYADVEPAELKRALVDLLVRMGVGVNIRGEEVGWTRNAVAGYDRDGKSKAPADEDDELMNDEAEGVDDEEVDEDVEEEDLDEEVDDEEAEDDEDEDEEMERGYDSEYVRAEELPDLLAEYGIQPLHARSAESEPTVDPDAASELLAALSLV